jgi:hypothetical protein
MLLSILKIRTCCIDSQRQVLKDIFLPGKSACDTINLPDAVQLLLKPPKDLIVYETLLWTSQVQSCVSELRGWGTKHLLGFAPAYLNLFFLVGPSGIGKSHAAFLAALDAMARGEFVLFVEDVGGLLRMASNKSDPSLYIREILVELFLKTNADVPTLHALCHSVERERGIGVCSHEEAYNEK